MEEPPSLIIRESGVQFSLAAALAPAVFTDAFPLAEPESPVIDHVDGPVERTCDRSFTHSCVSFSRLADQAAAPWAPDGTPKPFAKGRGGPNRESDSLKHESSRIRRRAPQGGAETP